MLLYRLQDLRLHLIRNFLLLVFLG